jgi:hypothetical protein
MRYLDTYDRSNRVFLCRGGLFDGVVDDEIQKQIIASEGAADFATSLQMNEQFLVHKLERIMSIIMQNPR